MAKDKKISPMIGKVVFLTPVTDICFDGILHNIEKVELPDTPVVDLVPDDCVIGVFVNPNRSRDYLSENLHRKYKNLQVLATASTGTNHIDKNYFRSVGVNVVSITEERDVINGISSTAEHAFLLTLASLRRLEGSIQSVHNGQWDFSGFVGRQLKELTVGVVGYGRLGKYYAGYSDAFGAKTLVYDPYVHSAHPRIRQVKSLNELFSACDVVSLHVHVTDETRGMICNDVLASSKKELHIINTSRGEICNEDHLGAWLQQSSTNFYATDVLCEEIGGSGSNSKLLSHPSTRDQITVTPHVGGMTHEARSAAFRRAAELLDKALLS